MVGINCCGVVGGWCKLWLGVNGGAYKGISLAEALTVVGVKRGPVVGVKRGVRSISDALQQQIQIRAVAVDALRACRSKPLIREFVDSRSALPMFSQTK